MTAFRKLRASTAWLLLLAAVCATGAYARTSWKPQEEAYVLVGNIEKAKGTATTDMGTQGVVFRGQIAFKAIRDKAGKQRLVLTRLNLLNEGVNTTRGKTGVIGVSLAGSESTAAYSAPTGKVTARPKLTLHYPLIDRIRGYRPQEEKGDAHFIPFTEKMRATIKGRLPGNAQFEKDRTVRFDGKVTMALDNGDPGLVPIMTVWISIEQLWIYAASEPSEILGIQPVFIGSGPMDLSATGVSFDTMIREAAAMWNRCGTERCLRLLVDAPMYLDNDAYRVLDDEFEAMALKDEVDIPDKIEIFVVERLADAFAVDWGGGATFASGTASAKIVTSDQNLDVPCPEPCTTLEDHPGGNAAMCALCSDTPRCGDVNYQHLSHELGHVLDLHHPLLPRPGLSPSTVGSVMEPSGFCCDNPDLQSALNCRNAGNPVLYWGRSLCTETPDILD
jgi:hypothetical protein